MTECQKCRNQIDIHLDNELLGRELETFLEHLSLCAECQAEFSERRSFLQGIRSVRPLYTASAGLHRRIAALLDAGTETSSISVTGAAAHIRNRCHNLPAALMIWRVAQQEGERFVRADGLELPHFLRQTVKSQRSLKGEI